MVEAVGVEPTSETTGNREHSCSGLRSQRNVAFRVTGNPEVILELPAKSDY
jgi:hypothetical protein